MRILTNYFLFLWFNKAVIFFEVKVGLNLGDGLPCLNAVFLSFFFNINFFALFGNAMSGLISMQFLFFFFNVRTYLNDMKPSSSVSFRL